MSWPYPPHVLPTVAVGGGGGSEFETVYDVRAYGAVGDGVTNDSQAFKDAVTAALTTGGTVLVPAGTFKLAPGCISVGYSTPTPPLRLKPLRIVGAGAHWETPGWGEASATPTGGTVLDWSATPDPTGRGVGCIETFHAGYVEITGCFFTQLGTAHTIPYLYSTNTMHNVHHNGFSGHQSKARLTCNQDALLFGGVDNITLDGEETAPFQGYGTVIANNWFNRLRCCVWGRSYFNNVVIRENTVWAQGGSDGGSAAASKAAIQIEGNATAGYDCGNLIVGNTFEVYGYYYGIRLGAYTSGNVIMTNGFFDAGAQVAAYVDVSNDLSTQHYIVAGFHTDTKPFVLDGGPTPNLYSTVVNSHQSQHSIFPGPVDYQNVSPGVFYKGTVTFAGGDGKTFVQPTTGLSTIENAEIFKVLRPTDDGTNPGGLVFRLLKAGTLSLYNSAGAEFRFGFGGARWQAIGAGAPMYIETGSGGSAFNVRAAALAFQHYSSLAELARMRIAPHSAAEGAVQLSSTGPMWTTGTGTPEGAVTAPIGSLYSRKDGGAGSSLYVKESGSGNTGWARANTTAP